MANGLMKKNLIPIVKYFWLTIKHKYYVFIAGLKIGCPIHLLIFHDLTKFFPSELPHYGRQFFGDSNNPLAFSYAWNHHQKTNKHHWEYWVPVTGCIRGGYKDLQPLPMPKKYILEMVADWCGASKAYEKKWPWENNWQWFKNNFDNAQKNDKLHENTYKYILEIIRNTSKK